MRIWNRLRTDDLLEREYLLATKTTDLPVGEHVLDADLDVAVVGTQASDGRPVLPVFTTEQRLVEWMPEGSPWIGLHGRDMLALFLSGEWEAIVFDPTEPGGREIERAEAMTLLGRAE